MGLILLRKPESQKASPKRRKIAERRMPKRSGRSPGAVVGANEKRFMAAITGWGERMRCWIPSATRRRLERSLFIQRGRGKGSEAEFLKLAKLPPVSQDLRAMKWARH